MKKWFASPTELLWEVIGTCVLSLTVWSLSGLIFVTAMYDLSCGFNPAVSLALAVWALVTKRDSAELRQLPVRIVCQTIGALVGVRLGQFTPGVHLSTVQSALGEFRGTTIFLILLIIAVKSGIVATFTTPQRVLGSLVTALLGGGGLLLGVSAAGPTGAVLNPAIWLGQHLSTGSYDNWGVHLFVPLLGALVALPIVWTLTRRDRKVIADDEVAQQLNNRVDPYSLI